MKIKAYGKVNISLDVVGKREDGYHYGATFIGMTDTDALKIDIYQLFNEQ